MDTLIQKSSFLQAFSGTNKSVPVWFMRQAGRYLPEYQAFKKKYSLSEMFDTPELAAEITCQPIDILGVDAAILFADILTLPRVMGVPIHFDNKKGPVIEDTISPEKWKPFTEAPNIAKTIELIKKQTSVPLIGFAGGPFTVLTYLVEKGSSQTFRETTRLMMGDEPLFHKMMDLLTTRTIAYLNYQKEAGIDAFQIFDTWAGILRPEDYKRLVLPYIQRIFKSVDLPSIYFLKNSCHLLELMDQSYADFLSVDHTVVLGQNTVLDKSDKGVQGNLYFGLLFKDEKFLEAEVLKVLKGADRYSKFIFNLSHGCLPNTPVDRLKHVVKKVHEYTRPEV